MGIRIWDNHVYYAIADQESVDFYDYDIDSGKIKNIHSAEGNISTSWAVIDECLIFESTTGSVRDGEKYALTVCENGRGKGDLRKFYGLYLYKSYDTIC